MDTHVADIYYMILCTPNKAKDLLIDKRTGGAFSKRVIDSSMMKNFVTITEYLTMIQKEKVQPKKKNWTFEDSWWMTITKFMSRLKSG